MNKRWLINKKYPEKFVRDFPEFSPVVLQLLWDRNLKTQLGIDEFFNPDYNDDIHNPLLLKDAYKAVKRMFEAFDKNEKILVYGDYDVDGVTSSAIMVSALLELKSAHSQLEKEKAKEYISVYIPDREHEGYGLNEKAIREAAKKGTNLIVTVDCGISSFENVKIAQDAGMEVIITDHHHVPEKVPAAFAVINPKQKDCQYPFKELSGAGVAFKMVQALIRHYEELHAKKEKEKIKLGPGFEKWLLDLVTLGTVADCVNLIGENRTLAKYGLLVLNKTRRVGLKKLISMAGSKTRENGSLITKKVIDTGTISFALAPRLNAAGRMDHANTSYELLITDSEKEAEELVAKLEKNNQHRQRLTEKMITEIKNRIGKYKAMPKVIIECDPEWKIGVVGLVAGKLTDEYCRPFMILQAKDKESAGSGRSIPEFNLIESIEKCKDILIEFGGHSQAAGLKVEHKYLDLFREKINLIADDILKEEHLIPSINIDCKISADQINWQLIDEIDKFNPFGFGNRKPVFIAENLEVHEVRPVGNNNAHLKLVFKTILENGQVKYISAIGFGLGKFAQKMGPDRPGLRWGDKVDVVFQLEVNQWNGNRELQMNVVDLKSST